MRQTQHNTQAGKQDTRTYHCTYTHYTQPRRRRRYYRNLIGGPSDHHPTFIMSSSNRPSQSTSTTSSPATASSISRINNIANHISPKMASTTSFPADVVPQAPEDALFGLMRAYRADESPNKVDLVGILLEPTSEHAIVLAPCTIN